MRFSSLFATALLGATLSLAAQPGYAQSGGTPIRPNRNAQFVFRNGEVVQRLGTQITPLAQNVRLPNGTKINVKSGIVEFPGGKITSLHEGDYINAEGGIVFGTPASAAAAQGLGRLALHLPRLGHVPRRLGKESQHHGQPQLRLHHQRR